jgi:threonine dehydratase
MIKLTDFYDARKRIQKWTRRTPMEFSQSLSKICGGEIWLKLENYQITGSFKIRGATNKLLLLDEKMRRQGVITASSGNHAQGISYVAQELGIDATIVVPKHTPQVKINAIREYKVDLIIEGEEYMDSERLARKLQREQGKTFVSAYNDKELIMGQGTIGLEMIEDIPHLDIVLIPVGGGGLASGVGSVFKKASDTEMIGVQSLASPVMYECIKQGEICEIPIEESYAEGLHGGIEKGSITFNICKEVIDSWIILEEKSILKAIKYMLHEHQMLVEGAAAVGPAVILENQKRFKNKKVGILISGGNLSTELLLKTI